MGGGPLLLLPPPQATRLPSTAKRSEKPAKRHRRPPWPRIPKSKRQISTAPAQSTRQPDPLHGGNVGKGPCGMGSTSPPERGAVELMVISAVTGAASGIFADAGMLQVGGFTAPGGEVVSAQER